MVPMTIEVPNYDDLYVAQMREELKGAAGFNHQNWQGAANFCAQRGINLDEALVWAENAISAPFVGQKDFNTLQTKATVLMAQEKMDEATAVMDEAIKDPTATPFQIHGFGRQLIGMGMADKALEVFEYNHEKFEGAWPTNVGMARGLSAVGRYDEAHKYAKMAHEEAPDQVNKNSMESAMKKLSMKQDIN